MAKNITAVTVWSAYFRTPCRPLYYVRDAGDIVHLVILDSQGQITRIIQSNCTEPTPFVGVDPRDRTTPMSFGEWIKIEDWKIAYDLG